MISIFTLIFAACMESPAETKAKLTAKRTDLLDEMYAEYGGGTLSDATEKSMKKAQEEIKTDDNAALEVAKDMISILSNTVSEVDREAFVAHCLTIGRGEHASILTDKAKKYFAKQDVKARCRTVHSIDVQLKELSSQAQP